MPFDRIEDAVLAGDVDAGLLIHEGQLTYADAGLPLWADLGVWWLGETGLPLPLGGNVVRRDLGESMLSRSRATSVPASATPWSIVRPALAHAGRYSRGIERCAHRPIRRHVRQPVDRGLGPRGRQAVQLLLDRGTEAGHIPHRVAVEFIG